MLLLVANIKQAATALVKLLISELVHTVLENEKKGSSEGMDGMPTELFMALDSVMVTCMSEAISRFLEQGTMPSARAEGLLAPIPKEHGSVSGTALRFCYSNGSQQRST